MKAANTNPRQARPQRNASEPFLIPMHNYTLLISTLLSITGKKKSRKDLWQHPANKFISFINHTLTLTTTHENESYTLTLVLHPQQLTIACSCATNVTTLCTHAYQYLFSVASYGHHHSFTEFSKDGIIETALSYPSAFTIHLTGRHGFRAELKNGLGRIFHLENNWVTPERLQPFQQLPGNENNSVPSTGNQPALCYLLMMSPREELAPFILPCAGILNKEGTAIKSFSHYLSPADAHLSALLTSEHLPRIKACSEIMKKSEATPGLTLLAEANETAKEALANLFTLFQSNLRLFRGAILYIHPWYGKKHMGHRPVKTWAHPILFANGIVTLRFRLHYSKNVYTLTLTILIDGLPVDAWRTEAAFFVTTAQDIPLYLFSSLRDAGIAFWMEKNKNRITVFDNHFPAFSTNILNPLKQHYEVGETGKKSQRK